jgi:hypothetical protein
MPHPRLSLPAAIVWRLRRKPFVAHFLWFLFSAGPRPTRTRTLSYKSISAAMSWLVRPEDVRAVTRTRAHWTGAERDQYVGKLPSESGFSSVFVEKNKNRSYNC